MKNIVWLFLFLLASCGSDSLVVNNSPEANIACNTALKRKLMRIAQFPTSADNLIDGTSSFAIRFPYTVVVNNQTVVINNETGYAQVRAILGANTNDTDTVAIQFPIGVTFPNYTQAILETQSQLEAANANVEPSVELSCMGFLYPLNMKTYNIRNQSAQTVSVHDQSDLHRFLTRLSASDVVSPAYPIQLVVPDGTLTIATNAELESAIDSYTDACLDALNAANPGPGPNPTFGQVLAQGTWHVSYFFRETVQTSDYAIYDFTFFSDGTAMASGGSFPISGTWVSYEDDDELKVHFVFASDALEELDESWTVTGFTSTEITMEYESGGSGTRYFNLTRN